jgi:transcription elongation factor GreA
MTDPIQFLTPEGKKKLEDELEYLRTVKRREVAANLKAAVEEGDISENAGYDESKRDQAFVEGRIQEISTILANSRVLEETDNHEIVSLGAHVTVIEEGETPERYQLVSSAEADPLAGRISNQSPLGRAIIGGHVGDRVDVQTPGGLVTFEIAAIE